MVTVSKKHQTSLALIAIVLATAMIAGTFASSSDKMAYATHIKKAKVSQSVSEHAVKIKMHQLQQPAEFHHQSFQVLTLAYV